jgi:hypothetical protein
MKKRIGKIGVLVIIGMFVAMMYSPTAIAVPDVADNDDHIIDIDNNADGTNYFSITHEAETAEIFRVQEDGRVSIGGDTSPEFKLEVTTYSGSGYFGVTSSLDGDIFIIDTSGNVGIGVRSPVNTLDVNGNMAIGNTYAGGVTPAPTNGLLVEGNVGIGVVNPGEKLEIDGNIRFNTGTDRTIYMETPATNQVGNALTIRGGHGCQVSGVVGYRGGHLYLAGGDGSTGNNVAEGGDVYVYGGAYHLDAKDGDVILAHTGSAIRGKVGIGTTTPVNPLEIFSSTSVQLRITNTAGLDYATFGVDSTGQLDILTRDGSGNAAHLCLMPDGDVGIQTTEPLTTLHVAGDVAFGAGSELTISSGEVTEITSYHQIDTESDASTDELEKINGGDVAGEILIIRAADDGRTVRVKNRAGSGNIILSGSDFDLDDLDDTLVLFYDGNNWLELSRSDNGPP